MIFGILKLDMVGVGGTSDLGFALRGYRICPPQSPWQQVQGCLTSLESHHALNMARSDLRPCLPPHMPDVLRISELGPQEVKLVLQLVLQLVAVAQQNMGMCFWTLGSGKVWESLGKSGKDEAKMAEESLPHAPGSFCWSPGAEPHVPSRVGWVFPQSGGNTLEYHEEPVPLG